MIVGPREEVVPIGVLAAQQGRIVPDRAGVGDAIGDLVDAALDLLDITSDQLSSVVEVGKSIKGAVDIAMKGAAPLQDVLLGGLHPSAEQQQELNRQFAAWTAQGLALGGLFNRVVMWSPPMGLDP